MTKKRRITMFGGSLAIASVLAVGPATHGVAAAAPEPEAAGPAVCTAIAEELLSSATGLTDGLSALPPNPAGVSELANGLLGLVTGLIDLGCLPAPELPAAAAVTDDTAAGTLQLPPLPVDPALPTVPVCTSLTAELLHAVTGVLAALLSTGLPDLTGVLTAITNLIDTLTGLADEACLPAAPLST